MAGRHSSPGGGVTKQPLVSSVTGFAEKTRKEGGIFYYSPSQDFNPLPAPALLAVQQQVAFFTPKTFFAPPPSSSSPRYVDTVYVASKGVHRDERRRSSLIGRAAGVAEHDPARIVSARSGGRAGDGHGPARRRFPKACDGCCVKSSKSEIAKSRRLTRAQKICKDSSHPHQGLFSLLDSRKRFRSLRSRTCRFCNSFFPQAAKRRRARGAQEVLPHNCIPPFLSVTVHVFPPEMDGTPRDTRRT
nr:uncharacterized protein LOC133606997 [Nerophis lumbriciformis]